MVMMLGEQSRGSERSEHDCMQSELHWILISFHENKCDFVL